MQTVKEHLESIWDEKARAEALENMTNPHELFPTIRSALVYAFDWAETPQGLEYWRHIWKSLTVKMV